MVVGGRAYTPGGRAIGYRPGEKAGEAPTAPVPVGKEKFVALSKEQIKATQEQQRRIKKEKEEAKKEIEKPKPLAEAPISEIKPAEKPKGILARMERKEYMLQQERYRIPRRDMALKEQVRAIGLATAQFGISAVRAPLTLIRHPIESVKGTAKLGYGLVTEPTKTIEEVGAEISKKPVSAVGETVGTYYFFKKAPKAVTAVRKKVSPFYKPVPLKDMPGVVTAEKMITEKPKVVYHVTEPKISMIKKGKAIVKPVTKGMGRERLRFARKYKAPETFLYVSPEKPYAVFGRQIIKREPIVAKIGKEALTTVGYEPVGYGMMEITKPPIGKYPARITKMPPGAPKRAAMAKYVRRHPGKFFPGTKTAAAMGFEEELVAAPKTVLYERPPPLGVRKWAYDPIFGRTVKVAEVTPTKPPTPKKVPFTTKLKRLYKEKRIAERKVPKITPEEKMFIKTRRAELGIPERRGLIAPTARVSLVPPRERIAPMPRPRITPTPRERLVTVPKRFAPAEIRREKIIPRKIPVTKRIAPVPREIKPITRKRVPIKKVPPPKVTKEILITEEKRPKKPKIKYEKELFEAGRYTPSLVAREYGYTAKELEPWGKVAVGIRPLPRVKKKRGTAFEFLGGL